MCDSFSVVELGDLLIAVGEHWWRLESESFSVFKSRHQEKDEDWGQSSFQLAGALVDLDSNGPRGAAHAHALTRTHTHTGTSTPTLCGQMNRVSHAC